MRQNVVLVSVASLRSLLFHDRCLVLMPLGEDSVFLDLVSARLKASAEVNLKNPRGAVGLTNQQITGGYL